MNATAVSERPTSAPPGSKAPRRRRGRVARAISGTAHAAVLALLATPFVGFWAGCSSSLGGDVTGYQALAGFTLPHDDAQMLSDLGLQASALPSFGPNLWIGLLIVMSVAGVAAAVIGGPRATAARLASAAVGIFAAWAAIAIAYPSTFEIAGVTVTTESDPGGQQAVYAVLAVAFWADGLSLLRWWAARPACVPPAANGPG